VAIICLSQLAFAITTDIKTDYTRGETMIIRIYGNILEPIARGNIDVLRGGYVSVPVEYDIKKLGGNYYLWLIAPKSANNYTLIIKNIATTVQGVNKFVDYRANFSVSENITDYYVNPGFISSDRDFEIIAFLNEDMDKTIETNFQTADYFTLKPGENVLKFYIGDINSTGMMNVTVGRYILPAYIIINKTEENVIAEVNKTKFDELVEILNRSEENLSAGEQAADAQALEDYSRYRCAEIPGKLCAADEQCSKKSVVTQDGACCVIGDCAGASSGSSYAWIGYLIAGLVIISAVFIWFKYKKTSAEKNPLQRKVSEIEKKKV
jgi:hypothetical protein